MYNSQTNQVPPELAAMIVKNYLLPMFESDEKKALKQKYNKLQSISQNTGVGKKMQGFGTNFGDFKEGANMPNSVFGELKLSEQLADELQLAKQHIASLQEQLEQSIYDNEALNEEINGQKIKLQESEKQHHLQK